MKKKLFDDFSTSVLAASENMDPFVFIPWMVSCGVGTYIQYYFDAVRNRLQTINIYWSWSKEELFRKLYANKSLIMASLQIFSK